MGLCQYENAMRQRLSTLLILTFFAFASVQAQSDRHVSIENSVALQKILDKAVASTLEKFKDKDLKPDQFAATVIDLRTPGKAMSAEYRGEAKIYAASVVKMFYMSYYFRLVEDGKLKPTKEVERGVRDMIVDSGNEATGYILDVLTGTTSGPEISPKKFSKWKKKRNVVNRYFTSLGYKNINVNQKTHCEDAYGVEQQFRNYKGDNRNMLTTNASARLVKEIVLGESVTKARSEQMKELMVRDWEKPVKDPFYQEFISWALVPGTKLWSKEGFTSKTRHDAAYIETPDGLKLVFAVFTENQSQTQDIIPNIAREVIRGLGGKAR